MNTAFHGDGPGAGDSDRPQEMVPASPGLRRALWCISAATVVSGGVQLVAPGFVLNKVGGSESPSTRQLFGTIGMFMVVVGGLLLQELSTGDANPSVVGWAAAQKFGASGAVAVGVSHGIFSPKALQVAAFDFASGVMCLAYRRALVRHAIVTR
jgi:hypothetical protein